MTEKMALVLAAFEAGQAGCAKSKRGVVIWDDSGVLGVGSNAPPCGFACDGSDACRQGCGKVAVHAEQRAILHALAKGKRVRGAEMLHTKVAFENGRWSPVPSGGPSCPDCSKLIVEAEIAGMWLLETAFGGIPALVRYTADEFHLRTLENVKLHVGRPVQP